eukprot:m.39564 g.39564  ORF g.39564 m.39564 type:complete len:1241 (+) comp11285_c0_seq1:36-3758(+)
MGKAEWLATVDESLADCVAFWSQHSLDKEQGGYFNCLDRDGSVYDTKKHVWLQGRQTWMLSRLYNDNPAYRTAEVLGAAKLGAQFLRQHTRRADGRVYFCVARDGQPIKLQRKMFAECFYVMALCEYSRAVKETSAVESEELFKEACEMFEQVLLYSKDPTLLGVEPLAGQAASHSLAVPMITLNVICELRRACGDKDLYKAVAEDCIPQIQLHVKDDLRAVLEVVAPDGSVLDCPEGRVLNCGHAIEAGWFVIDYAQTYCGETADGPLTQMGLKMIDWSLETGWDKKHGGIYYFLDIDGHSPEQLEWPMKLWWPHNEAMVATLLAYKVTKDEAWWEKFEKVARWTMDHFPDTAKNALSVEEPVAAGARRAPAESNTKPGGAWFGYLDRQGNVSQRFKGGPYKGFFHVPRALHLCGRNQRDERRREFRPKSCQAMSFTEDDVAGWDVESVSGWLHVVGKGALIEKFRDNDITGAVLIELDEDILGEIGVPAAEHGAILEAVQKLLSGEGDPALAVNAAHSDSSDEDVAPLPDAPAEAGPKKTQRKSSTVKDKKKDPLRVAAQHKAVADLNTCTVTSGFLWKIGGSGLKPKHWKRRFFVLTDDNCLYYFKSPKDMSALGMILLPGYTITVPSKSENVGNRAFAFKAFNNHQHGARKYVFAAEDEKEMKTWMNVMSLASIAFGSGEASMKKLEAVPQLAEDDDHELKLMQRKAQERVGGVVGDEQADTMAGFAPNSGTVLPAFLKKAAAAGKAKRASKGQPTLCLIRLLDGRTLQLYAEPNTTGQNFLDQICGMLNAMEQYYFGLLFLDHKGDPDWIDLEKKILKHEFPKSDHLELEFRIRFYPMDVTQVLQYVTLYQCFLAAKHSIVCGELDVSNKDAMLLASLALQAQRGDCDVADVTAEALAGEQLLPNKNMDAIAQESQVPPHNRSLFFAEEVFRVWGTLGGILRHLAVLKYMQIVQKHPRFAMQYFDIKNKKGTSLVMGVNPHGLYIYRLEKNSRPMVTFSWAECSELAFTEKKFTIEVHDKETKGFSVYTTRSKICQRILYLCIGLHRLYVQTIRQWVDAPADLQELRKKAIEAALQEREELKKEAIAAREKAKGLKKQRRPKKSAQASPEKVVASPPPAAAADAAAPAAAPASPGTAVDPAPAEVLAAPTGETVYIKGRDEAVRMMDMMMADEDFMRFQEEMLADFEDSLVDEMEAGGRLRGKSFSAPRRPKPEARPDGRSINDRVSIFDQEAAM